MEKQWYESWFDSPFYHILYKKRDDNEAKDFIDNLINYLEPSAAANVLDLACGKGRFSRFLANKGFEVTGLDLSENSIRFARQFESNNLSFYTHDMRKVFRVNYYDCIFSFFTSFGYFDSERDDLNSLKSVAKGLKKDGVYILDFFNSEYVIKNLVSEETKNLGGIDFLIKKKIEDAFVFKTIDFEKDGESYHFEERVRLFGLDDFERLISSAGMKIIQTFGDYSLSNFDRESSPRLVLVIKKT